MRTIQELLLLEKEGKELTRSEKLALRSYKKAKNYRHSSSFIYHSRKLPEEPNGTFRG